MTAGIATSAHYLIAQSESFAIDGMLSRVGANLEIALQRLAARPRKRTAADDEWDEEKEPVEGIACMLHHPSLPFPPEAACCSLAHVSLSTRRWKTSLSNESSL